MYDEVIERINALVKKRNTLGISLFIVEAVGFVLLFVFSALKLGIVSLVVFLAMVIYAVYEIKVKGPQYLEQKAELDKKIGGLFLPEIVKPELDKSFDDIIVDADRGIDITEFDTIGLFAVQDIYTTSDFIEGSYNGLHFRSGFSRVIRYHKAQGSRNTYEETFHGRTWIIDLPFSVTYPIRIVNEKISNMTVYRYQNARFGKEQKIYDSEFSKQFHVYSDSEFELNTVLSPIMLETLVQVRNDLFYIPTQNGMNLRRFKMALCFFGDKLYVQFENSLDGLRISRWKIRDMDYIISQIDKSIEAMKLIFDALDSIHGSY